MSNRGETPATRAARDRASRRLFWSKVAKAGPDECWEWTGRFDRDGYGLFGNGSVGTPRAHRRSWLLNVGPFPEGLCVLHHCDNPPCVNPAHLFLGTHADNARDREGKGRGLRAEQAPANKLTEDQAREIKDLAGQGWVQQDIADAYGVSQAVVSRIYHGETWKRVTV